MEQILYSEIELICMAVDGLLLYWAARREAKSASDQWLILVLICFFCNFGFNALTSMIKTADGTGLFVRTCLCTLYFISLDFGVFCWCGYAETEWRSGVFEKKKNYPWLALLLALPVLIALINLATHHLFYFDAQGNYCRGILFQVQMAYLLAVTSFCAVRLLRCARSESDPEKKQHMLFAATFPLCILAAWLLSFIGTELPVISVSIMLELLCMYTGMLNRQISIDHLTQVNNRRNMMGFLNYKVRNHAEDLFLFMIDVDRFKSINDTFGHLEGDNALIRTANVLKQACASFRKRPYIARYGGDEFIVILEGNDQDAELMKENIRTLLGKDGIPPLKKPLSLSIGQVKWAEGMDSHTLIAAADDRLYQIKKAAGIGR